MQLEKFFPVQVLCDVVELARSSTTTRRIRAIDPRLLEQIQTAGDEGHVEAVILVQVVMEIKISDERGPAGEVIDRVSKKVEQKPVHTRYFPRMGGVALKASGHFVGLLVEDESVISATAMDAGMFSAAT